MQAPGEASKCDWAADPGNNTNVNYKAVMNDVPNGEWFFYFNGIFWKSNTLVGWQNNKGTRITWHGEVVWKNIDMPGTTGDRCTFQSCKYDVNNQGTWPNAGLTDGHMHTDDADEWGWDRASCTQFDIWDKNPL